MVRRCSVLLLSAALLLGACSSDDDPSVRPAGQRSTTSTTRAGDTTTIGEAPTSSEATTPSTAGGAPTSTTTPSGPETPLAGAGGAGTFSYELSPARSEFCFRITASAPILAARVLRESGDPVIDLPVGEGRTEVNSCAATDSVTIQEIDEQPERFQAEVRTAKGTTTAPLR
jgi:hypothetical protein